jgi:intein-encoded DNA endonuclease-like protein
MFEEVLALRKSSHTYASITSKITERYDVSLSKATISAWVRGLRTPLRAGHIFVPKPTPELGYVVGVEAGDASLNIKPKAYQYRIRLQSVDREFVESFNLAVAKVLDCSPHRLWKGDSAREIHVEYGSYLLYKFLLQPLESLKPLVEHCNECAAAFLKGFFDSEGCMLESGDLTVSNSDIEALRYVQFLLASRFAIETTGPHLGTRKGSIMTRRGKSFRRNSDCYFLYVKRSSLSSFHDEIGLTILRKANRLRRVLASRSNNGRITSTR